MTKQKNDTASTRVRSRKPLSHATGKPVRGIRPGVRGPAKKPDEILAEQMGADRVIIIPSLPAKSEYPPERIAGLVPANGRKPVGEHNRNRKLARQLQDLVREIGNERVDPQTGWTRIEAVIRKLYIDAIAGKHKATEILLDRGWGKPVQAVQLNMRDEVREIMESTGLTRDEIDTDPILRELMSNAIDAQWSEPGGNGVPGSRSTDGHANPEQPAE